MEVKGDRLRQPAAKERKEKRLGMLAAWMEGLTACLADGGSVGPTTTAVDRNCGVVQDMDSYTKKASHSSGIDIVQYVVIWVVSRVAQCRVAIGS